MRRTAKKGATRRASARATNRVFTVDNLAVVLKGSPKRFVAHDVAQIADEYLLDSHLKATSPNSYDSDFRSNVEGCDKMATCFYCARAHCDKYVFTRCVSSRDGVYLFVHLSVFCLGGGVCSFIASIFFFQFPHVFVRTFSVVRGNFF